jgi:hypothetical protein
MSVRIPDSHQQVADAAPFRIADLDAPGDEVVVQRGDVVHQEPQVVEILAVGPDLGRIREKVESGRRRTAPA